MPGICHCIKKGLPWYDTLLLLETSQQIFYNRPWAWAYVPRQILCGHGIITILYIRDHGGLGFLCDPKTSSTIPSWHLGSIG